MYGMVITVYDKPIQVPQEMLDQVDEHIFIIGKAVLGTQLSHFPRKTRNKPDFILTVMCFCASQMFFKALHNRYSFNAFIVSASGRIVMQQKQWDGNSLDISSLTDGVYILAVGNAAFKFIKQ